MKRNDLNLGLTELFGEPRIVESGETMVAPNILGLTHFDDGLIEIPTFRRANELARRKKDGFFASLLDGLKEYIFGHEYQVEWLGRPRNEDDHARLEADYLRGLEAEGGMRQYAALALHDMRDDDFGRRVKKYYPVSKMARRYGHIVEQAKRYIESLYREPALGHG